MHVATYYKRTRKRSSLDIILTIHIQVDHVLNVFILGSSLTPEHIDLQVNYLYVLVG